jgi:Mg-chelatase subunit ChlD
MARLAIRLALAAAVMTAAAACTTHDPRSPAITMSKATPQERGALVLVLDRSGSMQGPKLEAVKEAATAAVEALDAGDQVAIVMFDTEATVLVPLQPSANRQQIAAELARVTAGGGTQVLGALRAAHDLLAGVKAEVKHVILFSDGEAATDGLVELARQMRQQQITISTIGVAGADPRMLELLSTEGGGRTYQIEDLAELSPAFVTEARLALR